MSVLLRNALYYRHFGMKVVRTSDNWKHTHINDNEHLEVGCLFCLETHCTTDTSGRKLSKLRTAGQSQPFFFTLLSDLRTEHHGSRVRYSTVRVRLTTYFFSQFLPSLALYDSASQQAFLRPSARNFNRYLIAGCRALPVSLFVSFHKRTGRSLRIAISSCDR